MQLPFNQQEMVIDIMRGRHIERRRAEIAADAKLSLAAFQAGQLRPQSASEIIAELRQDIDDAE
jgi:hypothetical protein